MNLKDFIEEINPVVVARGEQYYDEGRIVSFGRTEMGRYIAVVRGNEDYRVNVEISAVGEIVHSECNCPFDDGPYCKHAVAVFFALADGTGSDFEDHKLASPDLMQELATALESQSREELQRIILEHAVRYEHWAKTLLCRYVAKEDEFRVAKDIIWSSVDEKTQLTGVARARQAMFGAELVLDKASLHIKAGRIERGLDLCAIVLDFAAQVLPEVYDDYEDEDSDEADDGPSTIWDCLQVIEDGIEAAVELKSLSEQARLFEWVQALMADYRQRRQEDVAIHLLSACAAFAKNPENLVVLRKSYVDYGHYIEARYGADDYRARNLRRHQYSLLLEHGSDQEIDAFLWANLADSDYREKAIKRALAREDYECVLNLAEEALAGESTWGQTRWKKYMYTAYERNEDSAHLREMAEDFLFEEGFDWYPRLKAFYSIEDWPEIRLRLVERYRRTMRSQGDFMKFLVAEGLTDELLECCRRSGSLLEQYYLHLMDKHYSVVKQLFRDYIVGMADGANSRSRYQEVCRVIRQYRDAFGKADAAEVIWHMKYAYSRKRAFMEELARVKCQ